MYRVALFGHRDLTAHRDVEERLSAVLEQLFLRQERIEILIGRNGEFDIFAASVVKRFCKHENVEMTLVLPYTHKDIMYFAEYYDSVQIPLCVEGVHPKGAITKRNQWMVENCDLVICYIERESGGAYRASKEAERLGKTVINLATTKKRVP